MKIVFPPMRTSLMPRVTTLLYRYHFHSLNTTVPSRAGPVRRLLLPLFAAGAIAHIALTAQYRHLESAYYAAFVAAYRPTTTMQPSLSKEITFVSDGVEGGRKMGQPAVPQGETIVTSQRQQHRLQPTPL